MRTSIKFILLAIIIINIVFYLYYKYSHPFWSRSPVAHYYNSFWLSEGHIDLKRDPQNELVTALQQNEQWILLDTSNIEELKSFSHLLDNHYMYDTEFKYQYTPEFIKWSLNTPYKHFKLLSQTDRKLWSALLERDSKIIASVTSRPLLLNSNGNKLHSFYVDYLCIAKEARGQYLAPKMILKVEPAIWAENQTNTSNLSGHTENINNNKNSLVSQYDFGKFNMYIFKKDGRQLPFKYVCRYKYYYINTRLLVLPRLSKQFKKIQNISISQVYKYFVNITKGYKLFQEITISEFKYLFINDIVDCYVLFNENDKITGFSSFYNSQLVYNNKTGNNLLTTCETFYILGDNMTEIFDLTVNKVKEAGYQYIFTSNLFKNKAFIENYKFEYICDCYYHLYNYYAPPINPEECALILP